MTKFFLATSSSPVGDFTSVLPLLALHLTCGEGGSFGVVEIGSQPSDLHLFVGTERLSLEAPASVASDILRVHAEQDIVLFNAKHFDVDDVYRLMSLKRAAYPELERQGRDAIALVPFDDFGLAGRASAREHAIDLYAAGFEVRFVSCNLAQQDYYASVRGIEMLHSSIPPLGAGLIELIARERRSLQSLLEDPPANFREGVEHIRDWLSRCRKSKAFCDLATPTMPPPKVLNPAERYELSIPRLHSYWTVDTLAKAADDRAKL